MEKKISKPKVKRAKASRKGKDGRLVHSEQTLALCKGMYFEDFTVAEMVTKTNIPRSTIAYYINNSWKEEKTLHRADLFSAIADSRRHQFANMTRYTLKIMERALHHMATRAEPPERGDAKLAAEIFNNMDKIARLDKGEATEIHATEDRPIQVVDLKSKLSQDPFYIEESNEDNK